MSKNKVTPHDGSAILSEDGVYRYCLTRVWDQDKHPTVFIMMNPSTADSKYDDPTISKCCKYAKGWGGGGIIVVNLWAWRTPSPRALAIAWNEGKDVVGIENDSHIRAAFGLTDLIVCAWGNVPMLGMIPRVREVLDMLPKDGPQIACLGQNLGMNHGLGGSPKHPLYLRGDVLPQRYEHSLRLGEFDLFSKNLSKTKVR